VRAALLLLLLLLLAPALPARAAGDPLASYEPPRNLAAHVERRGFGGTLYLSGGDARFSGGGEALISGSGIELRIGPDSAAAKGDAGWSAISGWEPLLFPEILTAGELRHRFTATAEDGEIRLAPRSPEDRRIVTRVALRPGDEGRPAEVTVVTPDRGTETRIYSDWKTEDHAVVPPARTKGSVAWPPEATWGSKLSRTLAGLRAKAGEVSDLSGSFTREKRTRLLVRPAVARGTFRFVPGRLLWKDEEPRDVRVLITKDAMEVYDVGAARLERFPFGDSRVGDYVFLGFGDSLVKGLNRIEPVAFEVEKDRVRLEFRPRGPLEKQVRDLTLVLDRNSGLLRALSYTDASGDSVTTRLTEVRKNTGLTAADVALGVAPGVRVVDNQPAGPWR
jgi:hypothetical protein